ncbi:DNA primase small subunit [Candidatus Nitrosotalea sp. TS]|uniref:DNA primase small subunit domain-containing protein n=1 Tax=Candidatus Nitrosotalea sp. TS TaxID=2341020 RepID=UPI001ECF142F|nr:DNA primase small subunit domain-containing protein [Candidatus Nitrosotalea sp. TS]NHI04104.1 DNA primase small subunit [Candidatus Nitrosotalea sp. TS]
MLEKDVILVENAIKEYYFNHFDLVNIPPKLTQREFGYQKINGGMIRHIAIRDSKDLHLLMMKETPSDVYCSNAYYSFPSMPMSEKDWKGADLIFDIDAKDLALSCRNDHSVFKCSSCHGTTLGKQSACPQCGSTKFEIVSVACKNCIGESKKEVKKLLKMLDQDLDIKNEETEVYFSGNEGFHIKAINNNYEMLGSQERSDLVDYLMFNGAMPETFGMKKQYNSKSTLPEMGEAGWKGRVATSLFGSKSKVPKVTRQIISDGYLAFQAKLDEVRQTMGVKVDPKVTMDIHRIFRLEGSMNSKSGLSKIQCKNLDDFDPFLDACLLGEEQVDIVANCPVVIKLKNKKYGPYANERDSVPKYAACVYDMQGIS